MHVCLENRYNTLPTERDLQLGAGQSVRTASRSHSTSAASHHLARLSAAQGQNRVSALVHPGLVEAAAAAEAATAAAAAAGGGYSGGGDEGLRQRRKVASSLSSGADGTSLTTSLTTGPMRRRRDTMFGTESWATGKRGKEKTPPSVLQER